MRLCVLCVVSLALVGAPPSLAQTKEVTHQEIKEAIVALVRMFRVNADKLERHESRERHLGEQLKKTLAGLEKRHRATDLTVDAVAKAVGALDQRLQDMERAALQREEEQRRQQQATLERVQALTARALPAEGEEAGAPSRRLDALESSLSARLDRIVLMLDPMNARNVYTTDEDIAANGSPGTLGELESLLRRLEAHLEAGARKADSLDWHAVFLTALDSHQKVLDDLKALTLKTGGGLAQLPTRTELEKLSNATNELLQDARYELSAGSDMAAAKLESQVQELQLALAGGQEEILRRVSETGVMTETAYAGAARGYDQLLAEVRGLAKVETVVLQTADDVLDTKRRVEYGVHRILLEVGDLVKAGSEGLNGTVTRGFDAISGAILDGQSGALANVSRKIETEIGQVWRQIGIMYQQLAASAGALDRLQMQTETYVNGSLQTMDSMEGKVGQITGRMSEVDGHLNYLLGKLSLVTQEFNQIKSGLAAALDNIRSSFVSVQNKIQEVGPGPNPIPDYTQPRPESKDEQQNQVLPLEVNAQ
ncbi:uncharacterized protein LOC134542558 [Bacillus rossius redtenbacheri]|uniref:uncharacterized protein LOC134542558 n=1 Tax=Bacillus rossius redtenbacheri TaxID=93214 RepID=UPI002FDEEC5B